ncbi:Hypothetical protein A7982_04091 [Minicystis rosea]|nr:Hypothetical protein A7982_04091 [Minicystis rosea]
MNATTSRWGMFTDPSVVGVATAPSVIALVAALRVEASPSIILVLKVLAAAPLVMAILLAIGLIGARGRVIDWLAGLPFPVENLNAVLNGLGDSLVVSFRGDAPAVPEINVALEKVCAESFVTESGPEGTEARVDEPRWIDVRIGVVDSKRNPAATNWQRFERVQAIVREVLVPLAERHPIAEVRVR